MFEGISTQIVVKAGMLWYRNFRGNTLLNIQETMQCQCNIAEMNITCLEAQFPKIFYLRLYAGHRVLGEFLA